MKMKSACAFAVACALMLAACENNNGSDPPVNPPPPPPPPVNHAPVANAGPDAAGLVGGSIPLSASGSSDPDADTLTYSWAIVSGPAGATLSNSAQSSSSFLASAAGIYVIEITVRDPGNLSAVDSVTITISNPPPPGVFGLRGLPGHFVQGDAAALVVTLPTPAGAGGVQVTLLSSNPAAIQVPALLEVPEGSSIAALPVDASTPGAAIITASMPGQASVRIETFVEPDVLDIVASAGAEGLMVGGTSGISVTLNSPAPAAGSRVALTVSEPARASLAAATLEFAAGATSASTTLTALSPGGVEIIATLEGTASPERVWIGVIPVAASADRSSNSLIEERRAAGQITDEQALVYRVLATFGAEELPAEFRGNDLGRLEGGAMREAVLRFTSLSPAAQAAIAKYLVPPIYSGSWGPAQKLRPRTMSALSAGDCFRGLRGFEGAPGLPTEDIVPTWQFIRTTHFKIWYPIGITQESDTHLYSPEQVLVAAENVASSIERDYTMLLAVFGAAPLADTGLPCNGGDSAFDVYVTRAKLGPGAEATAYLPGACARPAWIWIAPDRALTLKAARNVVGHELVHLFQFALPRPNCEDKRYGVLDEAMASWSFDFLHDTDDYEHQYAMGFGSYFYGNLGEVEWYESPLRIPGGTDCNGYCDYPFFEWLQRKFGSRAIRGIHDATSSVNAQRAFETGLAGIGGGLEQLWPQFVLAMWNDYENRVANEWQGWEPAMKGAGLRANYVQAERHFIEARLDGQKKRDMSAELRNLARQSLPPMTMEYVQIKFTDENVAKATLRPNVIAVHAQNPRVRLQALQKIDGRWQPVEDWTDRGEISWCRDKRNERIQELILIYSNSHAGDAPNETDGPSVINLFDDEAKQPVFRLSGASCMPWHGTTSVTTRSNVGTDIRDSANVTFKPSLANDYADVELRFDVDFGTATVGGSLYPEGPPCGFIIQTTSAPISEFEGSLRINLDTREVTMLGLTPIESVMRTRVCPPDAPMTYEQREEVNWMNTGYIYENGSTVRLGDDGRTIQGSYVLTTSAGQVQYTVTYEWNLSSRREE